MYSNAFKDYLSTTSSIATIKFVVFLVGLIVVFLAIWMPYLGSLSSRIFRTKGMLNMIPEEIIGNNVLLRRMFVNPDLQQAIK